MNRIKFALFAVFLLVWLAADVSDARYKATVTITETSGSAQTNAVAFFPLSSDSLIDNGFAADDLLNTQLCSTEACATAAEVVFMPSPSKTGIANHRRFDTSGSTYTNLTTAWNNGTANDADLFDSDPEVGDQNFFAIDDGLEGSRVFTFNLGTAGVGTWTITWQYFKNGVETPLTNVQDNTQGFTVAGTNTVSFDMPTDWTAVTVDGDNERWLLAEITAFTSSTTDPVGTQAWYEPGVWFAWLPNLTANEQKSLTLFAGGADIRTGGNALHRFIPGAAGGIQTPDAAALDAGATDLDIELEDAYVDGSNASSFKYFYQRGSLNQYIRLNDSTDHLIEAHIEMGANDCDVSYNVSAPGEYTFGIAVDPGTNCQFIFEGAGVDTDSSVGASITASSSAIDWVNDGSAQYVEGITYDVNDVEIINYKLGDAAWSADFLGDSIEDGAGGDNDGVPSFPSLSSTITGTTGAFVTNNAPTAQDLGTTTGGAVTDLGTGATFAGTGAPSSNAPWFNFFNDLAGRDYDPETAGTQGINVSFFFSMMGLVLLVVVVGFLMLHLPFIVAALGGLAILAAMLQWNIVDLWMLLVYGVAVVLLYLLRRGIQANV